ncbi:MAG TPA: DUF72 domain-containing protein [Allosphingosinicella sp.]|nr:DUF72 domain-containing protein [Allosphingosinicella sp.]
MGAVIGTAGWSIPARDAAQFPSEGSALERYAARFAGVEINSSFHRPHRPSTWARWAGSVPPSFRFAVKMPKAITHQRKLADCADPAARFLEEVAALGDKLALLLVQLPPSLAFDAALVAGFFEPLAAPGWTRIVCEPRHPSWFEAGADALLGRLGIARAAADPVVAPAAVRPGGWRGLAYWRLHGSPALYRSSYDGARLDDYARLIATELADGREAWCMFDNTAASAATGDALALMARL